MQQYVVLREFNTAMKNGPVIDFFAYYSNLVERYRKDAETPPFFLIIFTGKP